MNYDNLSLLVSSFDKYFVCWEPFIHGLKKYWPEYPPLHFITNHLDAPCGTSLRLGEDQGWAKNLLQALGLIPTEFVLYAQEDYWIQSPVVNQNIVDYLGYLEAGSADYIRVYPAPGPDMPWTNDERLGIIALNSQYRASLQMTLWRKETLQAWLRAEETPWQFEVNGSKRSQEYADRFWCVTKRRHGIDYVFTAVVNGFWSERAYQYAKTEELNIPFEGLPAKSTQKKLFDHIKLAGYKVKRKFFRKST